VTDSLACTGNDLPSQEAIRTLLQTIAPTSTLSAVRPLAGSYSNATHLVEALDADGSQTRLVVRRYVHGNRAKKARLEFETLAFLQDYGVPAPAPLYLDEDGTVLGSPGIVTDYVSGKQLMLPSDHPAGPLAWARSLATTLAQIHSIPCDSAKRFLLNANAEATWFLRSGAIPDYMNAHPDGVAVWQAVHDLLPTIQQVAPALVHLDYWRGNVLWDRGQIAAVVDWEEAAYGDPVIDVAYCRMEMAIMGMIGEEKEFLSAYEAEMGHQAANLGFWELAAAARPMTDITGWITELSKGERFRQLIADATGRAENEQGDDQ
jgi:aminoglycoside phosphotransferase (APT) family kinase protein